jgi:hypothetical protein
MPLLGGEEAERALAAESSGVSGAPITLTIFVTVLSQPVRSWNGEFITM